jgi:hypothetical protein
MKLETAKLIIENSYLVPPELKGSSRVTRTEQPLAVIERQWTLDPLSRKESILSWQWRSQKFFVGVGRKRSSEANSFSSIAYFGSYGYFVRCLQDDAA